ncbi:MAG: hypothetical protein ACYDHN_13300 [Solirubrobacteraceae bacterium]
MGTKATAFGLDIDATEPISFLSGALAVPTGRPLSLSVHAQDSARAHWAAPTTLICDEVRPDGQVNFQIESHPDAGYLIAGPEYGAHLLSGDGRRLRCFPEGRPDGGWQRLLVAQVLPFAALLQGLEVFHASAVVRDGEAVAFLGPSRSGKTSLAQALCDRGASFLADDVLALEILDGELLANPGSPIAGVARSEQEGDSPPSEQVVAVNAREHMVRAQGGTQPARLSTLFFIDRRADGPTHPHFAPTSDPQLLLAATFNFVLATPERLQRLLEVCALAAKLRVELVSTGPETSAPELVDAIERRLSAPT